MYFLIYSELAFLLLADYLHNFNYVYMFALLN